MTHRRPFGPANTISTSETLSRLWDVVNERRASTTHVKVSVDDLVALLKDHAEFDRICKTTS